MQTAEPHFDDPAELSPYDAPRVEDARQGDFVKLSRGARRARKLVVSSFAAICLAIFLASFVPSLSGLVMLVGALLGFVGMMSGIVHAIRLGLLPRALRPAGLGISILAIPLGLVGSLMGAVGAILTTASFSRGRQLRKRSHPQFAELTDHSPWAAGGSSSPPVPLAPTQVADAWRKNGLTEHASVAAFARLATELVALGAPPRLIEAAHRDALDEMRHTELCFGLARGLDGRALGPGDFPAATSLPVRRGPRSLRLASLAVESMLDGALNEGISARTVAELASEVDTPRIKEVLDAIAMDEARHAAHAFHVMRWCVFEGGYPVVAALRGALSQLSNELGRGLTPLAEDGRFEAWGIPSRAREARAFDTVRARLVVRTKRLLREAGPRVKRSGVRPTSLPGPRPTLPS